jgi:vacuolar-type H+-ATPase subunit H
MEELQSVDVLDREILEDARRKAARILKTADDTVKAHTDEWEKKTQVRLSELAQKAEERNKQARDEIMARLPLDKQRICLEKMEKQLIKNIDTFFAGLPRERLLSLLESELALRAGELPPSGLAVRYRRLEKAEAHAILKRALPGGSWEEGAADSFFEHQGSFPAIRVEAPALRITASIDMVKETLLEDKRAELASALFGGIRGPWESLLAEEGRHD